MNYWKRAICSITRRKGKSLILFAVVFVLGNVIAGAIAIQQSTANVERKMKTQLGATVSAELDFEQLMNENGGSTIVEAPEVLTEKTIKQIGESPYVKDYDYNYAAYLIVDKFKTYQLDQANISMAGEMQTLTLKGTNKAEPSDFKNKKVKLVAGRMLSADEVASAEPVAIISKKVADENGLSVGDQMVLDTLAMTPKSDGTYEKQATANHAIKIIGLFEPVTLEKKHSNESSGMNEQFLEMDQFNTMYSSNQLVQAVNQVEFEKGQALAPELYEGTTAEGEVKPIYTLNSPDDVEAFKQEMAALLPTGYKTIASTDEFDRVGGSVKKLATIANYVVWLAILAALLIISLVVILFLRDRQHEWGIYLSLGEKRKNVLKQVLIEVLTIGMCAMCLSLVTGNLLGRGISESLLTSDALNTVQNASANGQFFLGATQSLGATLTTEEVLTNYQVHFSLAYILTFLIAGLSTILLAAGLPLSYVMRLNPKKIMM